MGAEIAALGGLFGITSALALGRVATIIAMATTMIGERMDALKRGKSSILEENHTLILGWSSRIFPILQQLAIANENVPNPVVVIFADVDREQMDAEINARVGDMKNTTIVTRTGDPSNPRDLARAAVDKARAVIVLDADETGDSARARGHHHLDLRSPAIRRGFGHGVDESGQAVSRCHFVARRL